MGRTRFGRWIAVLILIGLILGLIAARWPREPYLLERSAFAARTDGWRQGERFNISIGAYWLDDNTLLYDRYEGPQQKQRVIYQRDIHTGQETRLTRLTKIRDDFPAEVVDSQGVSPDGRWFLCSSRWDECLLTSIDGSQHYTYPSRADDCYREVIWMADSHHWLEVYANGGTKRVLLHDIMQPKQTTELPLDHQEELWNHARVILSPQQVITLGDTNVWDGKGPDAPVITITKFPLEACADQQANWEIAIPHRTQNYSCTVSPHGDKIAWEITTETVDIRPAWLKPFTPFLQPKSRQQTEIWVCQLDGSHMQKLGSVPVPSNAEKAQDMDGENPDLNVMWLPSGKKLSFEYQNALYTIPVE